MAEHQPRYPADAFTGPDTVVSQAKFDELVERCQRIARDQGGAAYIGRKTADGWTRVGLKGVNFGGCQLPPVADEVAS